MEPDSLYGFVNELLRKPFTSNISTNCDGFTTILLDFIDDELSLLSIKIRDDYFRSLLSKEESSSFSNTLSGLAEFGSSQSRY